MPAREISRSRAIFLAKGLAKTRGDRVVDGDEETAVVEWAKGVGGNGEAGEVVFAETGATL